MTQEQLNKPVNLEALQAATRKIKGKWDEEKERIDGLYSDVSEKQGDLETRVTEVVGEVTAEGAAQVDAVRSIYQEDLEEIRTEFRDADSTISSECEERAKGIDDRLNYHDFRKVDRNATFVLDGDGEQNLKQMMDSTGAYEQDAIMLSLEPIIPTASAHNFGIRGQIACDDTYLYVCTSENQWKKIPLQNL